MRQRAVSVDLIHAAVGAAIIFALGCLLECIPVIANAAPADCHDQTFLQHYYGKDDGVAFAFDDAADVGRIVGELSHLVGRPPSKTPVLVIFTIDLDALSGDFFLFDGDGCYIARLGMSADDGASLLDALGVHEVPPVRLPGLGAQGSAI